jgi:hypothetical protein
MCHLGAEETIEHLFFDCPSAVSRWLALGNGWEDSLCIHQNIYQDKHGLWAALLHGNLYDRCLVHLEAKK